MLERGSREARVSTPLSFTRFHLRLKAFLLMSSKISPASTLSSPLPTNCPLVDFPSYFVSSRARALSLSLCRSRSHSLTVSFALALALTLSRSLSRSRGLFPLSSSLFLSLSVCLLPLLPLGLLVRDAAGMRICLLKTVFYFSALFLFINY